MCGATCRQLRRKESENSYSEINGECSSDELNWMMKTAALKLNYMEGMIQTLQQPEEKKDHIIIQCSVSEKVGQVLLLRAC